MFCFYAICLLCLCVCVQKCISVSVTVSESKWLGLMGNQSFRTWRSEDIQTGQHSDPCLIFTLLALQETLCKAFLFPFVLFVTQCLSPCISSFEISAISFSNNLKTCFPVSSSLFSSIFSIERQSRHTLLYCTSQILKFLQIENKNLQHQKIRILFISIPTLWWCCGT